MLTDDAMTVLQHYPWPGNIRELANFLERMVILYHDRVLGVKDIELFIRTLSILLFDLKIISLLKSHLILKMPLQKLSSNL